MSLPSSEDRAPTGAWFALLLIAPIYMINSIDRQVISVVIEPLRHEFNLSDTKLGLLGGLGFGLMFALASLPIGWLIDRTNRVRLLATLVAVWSGLTALCGFANSYWTLLIARMGVGAAEAGGGPTAMSLISDYFAPKRRASAIGICYLSTGIGVALSFLLGSAIAAAYGWRAAFWVAGAPGVVLGIIIWIVLREPKRGASEEIAMEGPEVAPRLGEVIREITTNKVLLHLAAAITLSSFVTATVWIWATSLLMRFHGFELASAGRVIFIAALCQAFGSWIGGLIGDRAAATSTARLGLVAGGFALLTVPCGLAMALAPTTELAIVGLCLVAFANGGWLGPAWGLLMGTAPPKIRGLTASIVQLVCNLVGSGIGPMLTGAMSDWLPGGLRHALAISVLFSLWACYHYLTATRVATPLLAGVSGRIASTGGH